MLNMKKYLQSLESLLNQIRIGLDILSVIYVIGIVHLYLQ